MLCIKDTTMIMSFLSSDTHAISVFEPVPYGVWGTQDISLVIPVYKDVQVLLAEVTLDIGVDCPYVDEQVAQAIQGMAFTPTATQQSVRAHAQAAYQAAHPPPLPETQGQLTAVMIPVGDAAPVAFPSMRKMAVLPFPLTFASDMLIGLRPLMLLIGMPESEVKAEFQKQFPQCAYKKSTFTAARNVCWRALEEDATPRLADRYLNYGHSDQGLWKKFRAEVDGKFSNLELTSCY